MVTEKDFKLSKHDRKYIIINFSDYRNNNNSENRFIQLNFSLFNIIIFI